MDAHKIKEPDGKIECSPCILCEAGKGLSVKCGNLTPIFKKEIICVPCIVNKTFSSKNDTKECKPCGLCGEKEEEIIKCIPHQNRKCECKDGYKRDNILTNNCKKDKRVSENLLCLFIKMEHFSSIFLLTIYQYQLQMASD